MSLITTISVLLAAYGLFLLLLVFGLLRLRDFPGTCKPVLSILVPFHNEEASLPSLFEALDQQVYDLNRLEIILIDDRSSDASGDLARKYSESRSHVQVLSITDEKPGISPKKRALDSGIRKAKGEIILTTDADARPGPQWAASMAGGFEPDTAMVLGYAPYRTDAPYSTLFHRLLALEYFSIGAVAAALAGCNIPISANGANLAFRKTAFEAAGGYGESIRQLSGDDDLLLHRIRYSRRMKVRYQHIKESVVFNNPPENLARFYRQRMRFASKHGQYPPAFRFLLFGIYLMNASLFAGILQCIFDSAKTPILFLLALKALADLIFLKIAQSVLQERPLLRLYPIAFLPHILYILSVPIASRFFRTRW